LERPRDCQAIQGTYFAVHLDMAIDEGSAVDARRGAAAGMVRFGGVTQAKERQRRVRCLPGLDVLLLDLRMIALRNG
jgi:hypothetical protein